MIIEVLSGKYECNSEVGITKIKKPLLLLKLNSIIEWEFCKFPVEKTKIENPNKLKDDDQDYIIVEEEKRDFLGEDPELKPGNKFCINGQIIAVNSEDELVLLFSNTGYMALDRIYDEIFKTEFDLMFGGTKVISVDWKVNDTGEIPEEFDEEYYPPYCQYSIWKDRFLSGRGFVEKGLSINVRLDSENFIFPVDLIMKDWSVKYKSSQFIEDEEIGNEFIQLAVTDTLAWFYLNYPRVKPIK